MLEGIITFFLMGKEGQGRGQKDCGTWNCRTSLTLADATRTKGFSVTYKGRSIKSKFLISGNG